VANRGRPLTPDRAGGGVLDVTGHQPKWGEDVSLRLVMLHLIHEYAGTTGVPTSCARASTGPSEREAQPTQSSCFTMPTVRPRGSSSSPSSFAAVGTPCGPRTCMTARRSPTLTPESPSPSRWVSPEMVARGSAAAGDLPGEIVYAVSSPRSRGVTCRMQAACPIMIRFGDILR
jgi:hypothetical protein